MSANAAPSARKATTTTSKAPVRAAKHSKAVVEPVSVPVVSALEVPVVTVSAPVTEAPAVKFVSQEEIAKLAYCYWADRGFQGGNPDEDWARAEQALLA